MRIIQLSSMTSYYGGEVHLAQLARGLQERGHQVCCVVRPDSELARRLPSLGLGVRTMPLVDWYDPLSVGPLARLLRDGGPGVLHTHLPRDYFLGAVASLGTGILNVGTRHQLRPLSHPLLKRPFLKRFGALVAVSEAVRRGLEDTRALPAERLHVIPNGLPAGGSGLRARALRLRLEAGAGQDDTLIGFVGKLSPDKGPADLLEAVARVRRRWPRLRVCLVGDEDPSSGYRARLEAMVATLGLEDRVLLAGYRRDAGELSAAFDVQVVPSVAEPFGLVTLEAMQAGVPVVATDSGGTPEILRDGVEGFLHAPGDVDALVRKLEILVESPGLRVEMGHRGQKRAREEFSHARMVEATEALYRRLMDSRVAAPAAG